MWHKFTPRPVSRYFYLDWNVAVRAAKFPGLRPATSVIAMTPLLQEFLLDRVWILWWASLFFIASVALLKFRCPTFIQQYQYFEQYREQGHSHRWIVWQFFNNLDSLSGWEDVVYESVAKNITLPSNTRIDSRVLSACPIFPAAPGSNALETCTPVNLNRDIYVPIWVGKDRFVLSMQEADPELDLKIKELFWILATQAAKERPSSRICYWIMLFISALLSVIAVLNNVAKALLGHTILDYLAIGVQWIRSCVI